MGKPPDLRKQRAPRKPHADGVSLRSQALIAAALSLACGGGLKTSPPGNPGGEAGQASTEPGDAGADSGGAAQGGTGTGALSGEGGAPSGGGGQPPSECEPACEAPEQCSDGVCECPHELCDGVCTDTEQDELNCGACGTYCGNGECVGGGCMCPAPLKDCSQNPSALLCRDLQTDESACGQCGVICESSVLCTGGTCDASIDWIRIYGAETIGGRPAIQGRLVADAQGNLFASIGLNQGLYSELPADTGLWEGTTSILKLDPQGSFQWALPAGVGVPPVAVMGSDLWVVGGASADTSFFGQPFTLANGHAAMTMAVKLDGASQQVSDFFQLDHVTGGGASLKLLSDGVALWIVRSDSSGLPPPPGAYGAHIYVRDGSSVGIPGRLLGVSVQGGDVIVLTDLAKEQSYSFGGDTLMTGDTGARGIARYSSTLEHKTSFLIEWHWLNDGIFAAGQSSYLILGLPQKPFFQQYDGTGTLLDSTDAPFDAYSVHTQASRIYAAGEVVVNGGTVGEREFLSTAALLATFDETTQELERAITFESELPTDLEGPATVLDMVVTDNGASAVVLTSFKRGMVFRDQVYDFGSNKTGFALVKVKLY